MSDADVADDPPPRRPASPPPGAGQEAAIPLLVAVGIGGRIELTFEQVRLVKGGVFGHAVDLLRLGYGVIEKTIPVRAISAVEIVKPLIMPDFIRFSYPGSPAETGHYLEDALAENALLMSWFDNRRFYRLKTWLDRWPHVPPLPIAGDG